MESKVRIKVRGFVEDIRAGLSRAALMQKYGLTSRGLQRAFNKLIEVGALTREELPDKLPFQYATVVPDNIRDLHRFELDFELPIYEAGNPEALGKIRDVTMEGVGLVGIKCKVGDTKTLVTLGDGLGEIGPFEFEGECRWFRREREEDDYVAGFQITRITPDDAEQLRKLIRLVTLGA